MRRLFLMSILCVLALGLNAQTAKEEIFNDIHRAGGNYFAYPGRPDTQTPPPAGYKPFYLSHYGRHGSRFLIEENDYEEPLAIMREAERDGVLTELGERTLSVLDSMARMAKGRYGELTSLGARQHKGIAERMYENYPDIFKGDTKVDARSTVVIRCILSMTAECEQLRALNPRLRITSDASYHDMYYMNFGGHPEVNTLGRLPEVREARETVRKDNIHPERLMRTLFTSDDYVKWKFDAERLMKMIFELAANMQSHDTDMDLLSLFTKDECYSLWQINNTGWYLNSCAYPQTLCKLPFNQSNLLENIIETADACVANGGREVTLRFGHDGCLLALASLMEVDDCGYQSPDFKNLDNVWRNYKYIPMAGNIQLVFYRKKGSDDILVKALLNEKEARLPVKSELAPYYHWEDVKAYYRDKLDKFKAWQSQLES